MAERPTEQTYASDLKEWINQIIKEDGLPFSQAKVEIKYLIREKSYKSGQKLCLILQRDS